MISNTSALIDMKFNAVILISPPHNFTLDLERLGGFAEPLG